MDVDRVTVEFYHMSDTITRFLNTVGYGLLHAC